MKKNNEEGSDESVEQIGTAINGALKKFGDKKIEREDGEINLVDITKKLSSKKFGKKKK